MRRKQVLSTASKPPPNNTWHTSHTGSGFRKPANRQPKKDRTPEKYGLFRMPRQGQFATTGCVFRCCALPLAEASVKENRKRHAVPRGACIRDHAKTASALPDRQDFGRVHGAMKFRQQAGRLCGIPDCQPIGPGPPSPPPEGSNAASIPGKSIFHNVQQMDRIQLQLIA